MNLVFLSYISAIVILILLKSDQVTTKTKNGYVEMQFTPYNKNRQSIGIGGYLNSSPRRPRRPQRKPRPQHHHHYDDHHYDSHPPYEDDPYESYDNQIQGTDRCNCKTKYVAIEVPKGQQRSKKHRHRYPNRSKPKAQYVAVPVETISMNNGEEVKRKALIKKKQ